MNRSRQQIQRIHLTPDEFELCLDRDAPWGRSVWVRDHLRECEVCQTDLAFVETLDRHMVSLPYPSAPPGLADRVMSRVQLPEPWHVQLGAGLRAHWRAVAATAAVLFIALAGMGYWLFGEQGLTPIELAIFVWGGAQSLALEHAGVEPLLIQRIAGHVPSQITFNTYSGGASLEAMRAAIDRLPFTV